MAELPSEAFPDDESALEEAVFGDVPNYIKDMPEGGAVRVLYLDLAEKQPDKEALQRRNERVSKQIEKLSAQPRFRKDLRKAKALNSLLREEVAHAQTSNAAMQELNCFLTFYWDFFRLARLDRLDPHEAIGIVHDRHMESASPELAATIDRVANAFYRDHGPDN